MTDTVLALDGVDVSYGNTPILRDIDLSIETGETVGIMGRNGVGKTTLMKTVIGLLSPTAGTVTYQGEDVTDLSADRRARLGMGYIPQGRDVFPDLTVEQNVRMGTSIGEAKRDLVRKVYDYFPRLDERRERGDRPPDRVELQAADDRQRRREDRHRHEQREFGVTHP
jgi:branched-chain amino acid transport system ATP-binding protein